MQLRTTSAKVGLLQIRAFDVYVMAAGKWFPNFTFLILNLHRLPCDLKLASSLIAGTFCDEHSLTPQRPEQAAL